MSQTNIMKQQAVSSAVFLFCRSVPNVIGVTENFLFLKNLFC